VAAFTRGIVTHHPRLPVARPTDYESGGSGVRISSGAPFAYKTTNLSLPSLATCDDGSQSSLVANDSDLVIVDFDLRDDGSKEGLSGRGIAAIELFSHEMGEGRQAIWAAHRTRAPSTA